MPGIPLLARRSPSLRLPPISQVMGILDFNIKLVEGIKMFFSPRALKTTRKEYPLVVHTQVTLNANLGIDFDAGEVGGVSS